MIKDPIKFEAATLHFLQLLLTKVNQNGVIDPDTIISAGSWSSGLMLAESKEASDVKKVGPIMTLLIQNLNNRGHDASKAISEPTGITTSSSKISFGESRTLLESEIKNYCTTNAITQMDAALAMSISVSNLIHHFTTMGAHDVQRSTELAIFAMIDGVRAKPGIKFQEEKPFWKIW